jgi:large subunit ribosomal protein L24
MATQTSKAALPKLHIKKGDTVQVITGKDRGLQGKVIAAYPETGKVLVEGVNRIKKHTRVTTTSRGAQEGGIITQEAPIHASNVMLLDPEDNRPTRVRHRRDDNGRTVRVAIRSGKDIS